MLWWVISFHWADCSVTHIGTRSAKSLCSLWVNSSDSLISSTTLRVTPSCALTESISAWASSSRASRFNIRLSLTLCLSSKLVIFAVSTWHSVTVSEMRAPSEGPSLLRWFRLWRLSYSLFGAFFPYLGCPSVAIFLERKVRTRTNSFLLKFLRSLLTRVYPWRHIGPVPFTFFCFCFFCVDIL